MGDDLFEHATMTGVRALFQALAHLPDHQCRIEVHHAG
jgi:hypothetical protein